MGAFGSGHDTERLARLSFADDGWLYRQFQTEPSNSNKILFNDFIFVPNIISKYRSIMCISLNLE